MNIMYNRASTCISFLNVYIIPIAGNQIFFWIIVMNTNKEWIKITYLIKAFSVDSVIFISSLCWNNSVSQICCYLLQTWLRNSRKNLLWLTRSFPSFNWYPITIKVMVTGKDLLKFYQAWTFIRHCINLSITLLLDGWKCNNFKYGSHR